MSGEAAALVEEGLWEMAREVVRAYDAGEMPKGAEGDFADKWKAWIKATGKATGKKGKGLFHPIRLALTGRMSGPDVGEQVRLLHLAGSGAVGVVGLEARVKALKEELAKHPAPVVAG